MADRGVASLSATQESEQPRAASSARNTATVPGWAGRSAAWPWAAHHTANLSQAASYLAPVEAARREHVTVV